MLTLTEHEARVLGCLMEKAVTTPDQYPLTLNALTNACNQKSSRDPVLNLTADQVATVADNLAARHLVTIDDNFRSRVKKYSQRLCGTPFSEIDISTEQQALICLLLLRGPQTPGELRTRSSRLAEFGDNEAVREQLEQMMSRDGDPLVYRLPKTPGRQDHEYGHCFYGAQASAPAVAAPVQQPTTTVREQVVPAAHSAGPDLEQRVQTLEAALAAVTLRLEALEQTRGAD